MQITRFEQITSTNDEARNPRYTHGDIITAEFQTAGRGQRGNRWSSRVGENLMLSLVLEPTFLHASRQFLLSEAVALGLVDTLAEFGIGAQIKWTNDIYVGGRKICGVLIEHDLRGAHLARTIVGIGLNINQAEFDPALPNPTSMCLLAGRKFDREEVLQTLASKIMARYDQLAEGASEQLQSDYHALIYRRDEVHTYRLPDGTPFEGTIRRVEADGTLIVEHSDGSEQGYLFKQIEFVI
mgnify:FL=1